jgi:hypothetical protein
MLLLSNHLLLRLDLNRDFLSFRLLYYAFLAYSMLVICSAYLNLLHLSILIILGWKYKVQNPLYRDVNNYDIELKL